MALHADMEWEVRSGGNNNNGGAFKAGASGSDYSQQDAPQLALTDVVADGTTTLTSVTGGFVAAHVGNIVNVLTKGRFEITVVTDTNTITVDRNVSADTGLTGNVGGGALTCEEIDSLVLAGNTIHIEAGTYTPGGAIDFTAGTSLATVKVRGYKTTHGDQPTGTDRPVFNPGANQFGFNDYGNIEHVRIEGSTATYALKFAGQAWARNCKVTVVGNKRAFMVLAAAGNGIFLDCEAVGSVANLGRAFETTGSGMIVIDCFAKTIGTGINIGTSVIHVSVIHCTFKNNQYGIYSGSAGGVLGHRFLNNNLYNASTAGIHFVSPIQGTLIMNNNFKDCVLGIEGGTAGDKSVLMHMNNFHGCTTDVNNIEKGDNPFAFDPEFVDAANDDFNMEAAAQAFITRLGVG